MSHSKLDRLPIEEQITKFRPFVVACTACGRKGRSESYQPAALPAMHPSWVERFERAYEPMPLDELGRCPECAAIAARSN